MMIARGVLDILMLLIALLSIIALYYGAVIMFTPDDVWNEHVKSETLLDFIILGE